MSDIQFLPTRAPWLTIMYDGRPISSTARSMMSLGVGGVKPVRNRSQLPQARESGFRFSDMHILSCVSGPFYFRACDPSAAWGLTNGSGSKPSSQTRRRHYLVAKRYRQTHAGYLVIGSEIDWHVMTLNRISRQTRGRISN